MLLTQYPYNFSCRFKRTTFLVVLYRYELYGLNNVYCNRQFHNRVYGADFPYSGFGPLFKAELYDPSRWADIFSRSGARYIVLTSKHHDGYALWDSPEARVRCVCGLFAFEL